MAYIKTEEVAQIRKTLKEKFPGFKFSVRKEHHSSVNVTILSGPISFDDALTVKDNYYDPSKIGQKLDYTMVNQYHCNERLYGKDSKILSEMIDVIKYGSERKYFDKSDAMTDYFHVAFYFDLSIGSWEKPYQFKA